MVAVVMCLAQGGDVDWMGRGRGVDSVLLNHIQSLEQSLKFWAML